MVIQKLISLSIDAAGLRAVTGRVRHFEVAVGRKKPAGRPYFWRFTPERPIFKAFTLYSAEKPFFSTMADNPSSSPNPVREKLTFVLLARGLGFCCLLYSDWLHFWVQIQRTC